MTVNHKQGWVTFISLGGYWHVSVSNTPKAMKAYLAGHWTIVSD